METALSELNMKKLAELANLDVSTVSRALRGDTKRVAASTIERVQRLARAEGYVADPIAASLRSGRSQTVGVLVYSLTDIVMGILVTAIEEACRAQGYLAVVVATHDDVAARDDAVVRLLGRRVDGFVLCDSPVGAEVPSRLVDRDIPFVLAMRGSTTEVSVTADDRLGGRLVAQHFLDAGHRTIAVVPGPTHARTAVDRLEGFVSAIAEAPPAVLLPVTREGGFDLADGYRCTQALLRGQERPTAIFCANDHTAMGAARALVDHGLRVGRDVALVGYNDVPQAAFLETPLSSVRTDVRQMGVTAAATVVSLIEQRTVAGTLLKPTLVVRASSAGAAPDSDSP